MVLLDDSFSTIVFGIQQGRLVFANLRKTIKYTLAHITPQIVPFVLFFLLGLPIGLSNILVLLVDLGTELVPAISLAWEPEESELMKLPPRSNVQDETRKHRKLVVVVLF